jgi:hypothetical protein
MATVLRRLRNSEPSVLCRIGEGSATKGMCRAIPACIAWYEPAGGAGPAFDGGFRLPLQRILSGGRKLHVENPVFCRPSFETPACGGRLGTRTFFRGKISEPHGVRARQCRASPDDALHRLENHVAGSITAKTTTCDSPAFIGRSSLRSPSPADYSA